MTQDEIQAVARAICDDAGCIWDDDPNTPARLEWSRAAKAAIAAIDAARGKAEPVAWMYRHPDDPFPPSIRATRHEGCDFVAMSRRGWVETPLYAHPPAPDAARGDPVARLIAHMKTIEPDEETAGCPATWADFIQILEGIAEAWEPFNG